MYDKNIRQSKVHNKYPLQWKIPPCIRHMPKMPLYLSIAWWGFYRGVAFNRHDASQAFGIDPNRVSTAMSYIIRRCEGRINFESNIETCCQWNEILWLKIISIDTDLLKKTYINNTSESEHGGNNCIEGNTDSTEQLSKWFLKMPSGNSELIKKWKLNCPINRR
ncbi:hypothetical protein R9D66_004246 [Citrobacter amalonaticus]|nr:hypothetical protein [Citrobacter amalonaticus]